MTERNRRPRHQRVVPEQRPPMVLMERDVEIIETVNRYQVMVGRQIETLFFSSNSAAQYRLSRLYHHEYLDRHFLTVVSGGPASSPILYSVGRHGAQVLVRERGLEPQQVQRLGRRPAWKHIEHLLAINDVRLSVTLACRTFGFVLEEWLDEKVFRQRPDTVVLKDEKTPKPVLPDGYFCLQVPQGKAHFFLEVDRATEPHHKFKPQVMVYQAYTASGGYTQRFQTKSLRILIVTTSEKRLENLKTTTRQADGDRKYLFTTFDQIRPETVLTAPIWQPLEGGTPQPLITPS